MDFFFVVLFVVGVLDMFCYYIFSVNVWVWFFDYGLSENKDEFEVFYVYLLFYNIKLGMCYLVILVIIGDYDDCVVLWYSYKFVV